MVSFYDTSNVATTSSLRNAATIPTLHMNTLILLLNKACTRIYFCTCTLLYRGSLFFFLRIPCLKYLDYSKRVFEHQGTHRSSSESIFCRSKRLIFEFQSPFSASSELLIKWNLTSNNAILLMTKSTPQLPLIANFKSFTSAQYLISAVQNTIQNWRYLEAPCSREKAVL